ncbi:flagellar motor switch protein FliG [Falsiroseomonas sp.]|jgi:flagellar motor switch protein FliG|uniref:flagellar motor switch protein FliG n=1 Tax=Falsiroseomonas sp. TaxID=2870721 RepID=UPI003F70730D
MSMTYSNAATASLSGPHKAAVLMLALGEERAAMLLGRMHDDEVRDVSAAMASLGPVSAPTVEQLCNEFSDALGDAGSLMGGWEATERLLLRSLPKERVSLIMDELRGPAGRTMWDKLGNVNENVLANYLKNEYPQTVAVVLSRIRPDHAARVLSLLPEAFSMEVVMRMLRMESPQAEALEGVERTLKAEFMSNLARATRRDPHELMAEIFNNLDRSTENRMMAALEGVSDDSASRIRQLMFTFEDLKRLDANGIPVLLRAVEKDKLAIALKGASEQLRELFLRGMSERAGRMLRDDIAALGPVRLKDVEEAQAIIVALAKDLSQQGALRLTDGGQEMMVE